MRPDWGNLGGGSVSEILSGDFHPAPPSFSMGNLDIRPDSAHEAHFEPS